MAREDNVLEVGGGAWYFRGVTSFPFLPVLQETGEPWSATRGINDTKPPPLYDVTLNVLAEDARGGPIPLPLRLSSPRIRPIVIYDIYDGEFVGEARTKKETRRFGIPRVHPTTKMVTLRAGKLQLPFKPLG